MRALILITTFLFILSLACTAAEDSLTSPTDPCFQDGGKSADGYVNECRANMRTIAGQCTIFFAGNSRYPNSLEEIGMSGVCCPECNEEYELIGTRTEYYVGCPIPDCSSHGFIENGIPSWANEPEPWEDQCQATMWYLFCGCVMYFAENNYYPADQASMDEPYCSMVCPECETPYDFRSDEENCVITCPLPTLPNHGQIINGSTSWDQDIIICRANMRTIAGQCTIFFAGHNRYPDNLEEMGMEYFICPSCMTSYNYYLYENSSGEWDYFIGCPIQEGSNHGCIDAGVPSWFE